MSLDYWHEQLLIDLSRVQREAIALPVDTGETYDKDGKIVKVNGVDWCDTNRTGDYA